MKLFCILHEKAGAKTSLSSWTPMAHSCNPSYSGGRDQEDHSSKPALASSPEDPISEKKKGGGLVEWLKGYRTCVQTPVPKKKKSHFVTDVTNSIRVLPSHAGLGYSDTWRSVEPKPSGSASTWQCLHQVRHHLDSSLALRGRWPGGGRGGQRGDTERCILPALPPLHTPHTLLRR
jgi:hypothetical protein